MIWLIIRFNEIEILSFSLLLLLTFKTTCNINLKYTEPSTVSYILWLIKKIIIKQRIVMYL
jgi:hypothetical protein